MSIQLFGMVKIQVCKQMTNIFIFLHFFFQIFSLSLSWPRKNSSLHLSLSFTLSLLYVKYDPVHKLRLIWKEVSERTLSPSIRYSFSIIYISLRRMLIMRFSTPLTAYNFSIKIRSFQWRNLIGNLGEGVWFPISVSKELFI